MSRQLVGVTVYLPCLPIEKPISQLNVYKSSQKEQPPDGSNSVTTVGVAESVLQDYNNHKIKPPLADPETAGVAESVLQDYKNHKIKPPLADPDNLYCNNTAVCQHTEELHGQPHHHLSVSRRLRVLHEVPEEGAHRADAVTPEVLVLHPLRLLLLRLLKA